MTEKKLKTKEILLNTAERLFAVKGFESTSIRDIVSDAGLSVALINYHFGSKKELIKAVIDRIILPVDRERVKRMRALAESFEQDKHGLTDLMAAYVTPIFQLLQDEYSIKLLARVFFELPLPGPKDLPEEAKQLRMLMNMLVRKMLPERDAADLELKMYCIMSMINYVISIAYIHSSEKQVFGPKEYLKGRLIQYSVSVLKTENTGF